jgi:hypothetical protein
MRGQVTVFLLLLLSITGTAFPKDKKEQPSGLPEDILRARTIMVVIAPNAGEPLKDPLANARAQDDVEKALLKWRRFEVVSESSLADLVISVRRGTGNAVSPTIKGGPIDQRPVIFQPTDGSIRVGGHTGQPTDASGRDPIDSQPHLATEFGSPDDTFEVYRGRQNLEISLEGSPVWRYTAKDSLRAPKVTAVEQFRKAIDASEKADSNKRQPKS